MDVALPDCRAKDDFFRGDHQQRVVQDRILDTGEKCFRAIRHTFQFERQNGNRQRRSKLVGSLIVPPCRLESPPKDSRLWRTLLLGSNARTRPESLCLDSDPPNESKLSRFSMSAGVLKVIDIVWTGDHILRQPPWTKRIYAER